MIELHDDAVGIRADRAQRLADELVHRPQLEMRLDRAGLEPGHVEQVRDDTVEPRGLFPDGGDERVVVAFLELDLVARERLRAGDDRGQRRAEIMRDRAQERRLDHVAAPERFRLERFRLERGPADGDGQQGGERGQESPHDGGVRRGGRVDEQRRHPAQVDLDPRRRRAQRVCGQVGELVQLGGELGAAQQVAGGLGEHGRLATPLLGVLLPAACARRERADDDRSDEVDGEREPICAVAQLQRVLRRQEEPVEREHARDRDRNGEAEAPCDRDRQHGEDVQHAEAEHGHVRVQRLDRAGDDDDRADARQ